jgi:hypothetical protein
MDTPNTRSRKRRETVLGSDTGAGPSGSHDEGGTVHWVHDNKLRKMVMEATENGECDGRGLLGWTGQLLSVSQH